MAVKKSAVKKKAATKKAVAAPVEKKIKAIKEPMTKTAILNHIAEETELTKKQVAAVFDSMNDLVHGHIKKRSAGSFTLPGLLKIVTLKVPARRAKKNVPNPFRPGETMDVAARPAFTRVKIRALKKLKDMSND